MVPCIIILVHRQLNSTGINYERLERGNNLIDVALLNNTSQETSNITNLTSTILTPFGGNNIFFYYMIFFGLLLIFGGLGLGKSFVLPFFGITLLLSWISNNNIFAILGCIYFIFRFIIYDMLID